MSIQFYPDELDYVNAQLKLKGADDTSFLGAFCKACLLADGDNYGTIRYALHILMEKYPLVRGAP